jgi:hypothetical protein
MVKKSINPPFLIAAFLFLMLAAGSSFAQNDPLFSKLKKGDTLKVSIERNADFGLYDRDLFKFVKNGDNFQMHSDKRGRWYKLNKDAVETFKSMEKRGLKQPRVSLKKFDAFTITMKEVTESFQLLAESLDGFMKEIK